MLCLRANQETYWRTIVRNGVYPFTGSFIDPETLKVDWSWNSESCCWLCFRNQRTVAELGTHASDDPVRPRLQTKIHYSRSLARQVSIKPRDWVFAYNGDAIFLKLSRRQRAVKIAGCSHPHTGDSTAEKIAEKIARNSTCWIFRACRVASARVATHAIFTARCRRDIFKKSLV